MEGLDEGFLDGCCDDSGVVAGQVFLAVEEVEDVVAEVFAEVDDAVVVHGLCSWLSVGAGCRPPACLCGRPEPSVKDQSANNSRQIREKLFQNVDRTLVSFVLVYVMAISTLLEDFDFVLCPFSDFVGGHALCS